MTYVRGAQKDTTCLGYIEHQTGCVPQCLIACTLKHWWNVL